MDTVATLWDEAGDDAEAQDAARRMAMAKSASSDVYTFLSGASSVEEFRTRAALQEAALTSLAQQAGVGPLQLVAALQADWEPILAARTAAMDTGAYFEDETGLPGASSAGMPPPVHKPGDHVTSFRGEHARVVGVYPSKHPGKSHRVQVQFEGDSEADPRHFYEQVFDPRDFHTSKEHKKHHEPASRMHGWGMGYGYPWPGFFPCPVCNGGGVAPGASGDGMGTCPGCGGSGADDAAGGAGGDAGAGSDAGGGDAGGGTTATLKTADTMVEGIPDLHGPNYDPSTSPDDYTYRLGYGHGVGGHTYQGYGSRGKAISYGNGYHHGQADAKYLRAGRHRASFAERMASLHTALEEGADPLEWIEQYDGPASPANAEKPSEHVSTPAAPGGASAGQQVGVTSEAGLTLAEQEALDSEERKRNVLFSGDNPSADKSRSHFLVDGEGHIDWDHKKKSAAQRGDNGPACPNCGTTMKVTATPENNPLTGVDRLKCPNCGQTGRRGADGSVKTSSHNGLGSCPECKGEGSSDDPNANDADGVCLTCNGSGEADDTDAGEPRRHGSKTARHEPIAYTYEADIHCPGCTKKRFGPDAEGTDNEGNQVHPVAPWDETSPEGEHCGTCGREIAEPYKTGSRRTADAGAASWKGHDHIWTHVGTGIDSKGVYDGQKCVTPGCGETRKTRPYSSDLNDADIVSHSSIQVQGNSLAYDMYGMKDGDQKEFTLNGHGPYKVRYDSHQAEGDDGRPARGFHVGGYDVQAPDGTSKYFRHTPHGPGLSGAQPYAADNAARHIVEHFRQNEKRNSTFKEHASLQTTALGTGDLNVPQDSAPYSGTEIQPGLGGDANQASSKPRQLPSGGGAYDPLDNGADVADPEAAAGPEPTTAGGEPPAPPGLNQEAIRRTAARLAPMVRDVMKSNPGLGYDAAYELAKQALHVEGMDALDFGNRGNVADGPLTTKVKNWEPKLPKGPGQPGGNNSEAAPGEAGEAASAGESAGIGAEVAEAAPMLLAL